jgi:RNA polymerase sigma factor (sigma-70 family)
MSEEASFAELMERVRQGDETAMTDLVRRYEPAIRRAIHVRLLNPRMRRVVESLDICQSVMGSFFVRIAFGQFEIQSPEDLMKLLVRMARNKVADAVRKEQADRRDNRRVQEDSAELGRVRAGDDTPSVQVATAELLNEFRRRLTEEERHLAEQRALGREWVEIAEAGQQSPEACRKRLARAIDRVAQELGLEDFRPE